MYIAIILLLIGLGLAAAIHGSRRGSTPILGAGVGLIVVTAVGFGALDFVGELLWFRQLGYADRFWTEVGTRLGLAAVAAMAAAALVALLTKPLGDRSRAERWLVPAVAAVFAAGWGARSWETFQMWWHRVPTDRVEPLHGLSTGFYLFTLPFLHGLLALAMIVVVVAGLAIVGRAIAEQPRQRGQAHAKPVAVSGATQRAAGITLLVFAVVLAYQKVFDGFDLVRSDWGVVHGAGWVDANVRLPMFWLAALVILAAGIVTSRHGWRERIGSRFGRDDPVRRQTTGYAVPWATAIAVWIVILGVVPGIMQWLRVEPSEITREKPYLERAIRFTRAGFGLDTVEEREFPVSDSLSAATVETDGPLLGEVRLWDWRALDAVYRQFQEIRLYYEFADVDVDRYRLGSDYRQVMISAREMVPANLPQESRTFVNRRFKYTHGYGVTLAPVNEFTPDGRPDLLVRDIPPVAERAELELERPEIYYGERTDGHVVVNSREDEFDYPKGDENAYVRYAGTGGVPIDGIARRFLFGWKFDGTRLFLSDYPRDGSRVMFHRRVVDRVKTLAPFLTLDSDPYIAIADGRLFWIVDAYTTSSAYPYSEPYDSREEIETRGGAAGGSVVGNTVPTLRGVNYVRNSVKVIVDAYEGDVHFYVFDPDDALIRAWRAIFPELFRDREDMPAELAAHVRYPCDLLLAQALVYAKYHMRDPEVFYNQEDLWVRATEKYYSRIQPVEPYYVMWQPPGARKTGFVLMLPFTPKNRQVLIGWIAGMCDGEDYGRLFTYKFPKDQHVLGPQQVETKIDQDRFLSGQLSLWDQRGSRVIRGNVLAIPLDRSLLYVEPIYLQAETAAYPELRLVVVMHQDDLSYGETFDEAIRGLIGGASPSIRSASSADRGARTRGDREDLIRRASEAFEEYLDLQAGKRFPEAAEQLEDLSDALEQLRSTAADSSGPAL
ncbi:MAG: UPF0182 family protein [bacterium]